MKICIDDLRHVHDADEHYRTAATGLYRLVEVFFSGQTIETLYLDHDLGGTENTRLCADFVAFTARNNTPFVDEVLVISQNPSASEALVKYLAANGVNVNKGIF